MDNNEKTSFSSMSNNANEIKIGFDRNRIDGIYPKPGSKDYSRANFSDDIVLGMEGDLLSAYAINDKTKTPEPVNKLKVENGYIIGFDMGEFGGSVHFTPLQDVVNVPIDTEFYDVPRLLSSHYSHRDSGESYNILNENFRGFILHNDRKFVLTGIAHMTKDVGCLYELLLEGNIWHVKKLIDIGSRPHVFVQSGATTYLASSRSLLRINQADDKLKIKTLVKNVGWGSLYPNSLVYANDSLYVGMRGFIYEYNLKSGKEKWYNYISYDAEDVKSLEKSEWFNKLP